MPHAKNLKLQLLRLLPREILVREVAVLRRREVAWLSEIELLDNDTRPHVEVLADNLHQLIRIHFAGTVGLDEDGQGLGDTDGVGELDEAAARQLGCDEGLGDPAGKVGGGAVDLGVVLAGESTTTVSAPAAVGVDNDLAAGESCVALGAADYEEA